MKWDSDWTAGKNKNYYSKNVDNESLFHRIKYHAQKSPRIQIQEMYRNVFDAIEKCSIDDEGYNALEDLLVAIHFPEQIEANDYNDKYVKARSILEYIFRSMSAHGMLPNWGKQVNLQWSSCLLSGMPATRNKDGKDIVVIESKKQVLPPVLKRVMKEMVIIIPAFCHSDNKEENEIKKEEYLKDVDSSTFLLKSFTYQLCDLILWYRNYLQEHPNAELNTLEWKDMRKQ
jgi:hypothetical protein